MRSPLNINGIGNTLQNLKCGGLPKVLDFDEM